MEGIIIVPPNEAAKTYITKQPAFAVPILSHLYALVLQTCPEAEQVFKWGKPAFLYRGKLMCSMAAFTGHASFGFWQERALLGESERAEGAGSFGKLKSLEDLPDDQRIIALIKAAMDLIDTGGAAPMTQARPAKAPPTLPPAFQAALGDNKAAKSFLDSLPPSQVREYGDWINDAKQEATRAKRIAQSVEWLSEGKRRNWKYENC
jgi:uncharacterized protein YdeI (YjbR/CyaY-like superfamily)